MVFSSSIFLFFFLPLTIIGSIIIKPKYSNIFLLIMSLIFYSWGEPSFVLIFLVSMVGNYLFGLLINYNTHKRFFLILSIIFNIGLLVYFKYFGFILGNIMRFFHLPIAEQSSSLLNIALPIGISFYTFQAMSYIIDLYKGEVQVQKNPLKVMLYISLFPQLIAGPIVRYIDVEREINNRKIDLNDFEYGIKRFIVGLGKKVLVANTVAQYADVAFSTPNNELSSSAAWLGIISYALQIYFDFSGYSDMAIGIGRMLGFKFLENFNYPYIAKSIQDFWRRWHISLSTWFRDYLYIPLGGNRKGTLRTFLNLFIVFFLCGLWHGAQWTFLIWGIYQGIFLSLERVKVIKRFIKKMPRVLQHLYACVVILIGWVFFRAETMGAAFDYIKKMFNFSGNGLLQEQVSLQMIVVGVGIGLLFSMPIVPKIKNLIQKQSKLAWLGYISLVIVLLLSILRIVPDSYNPFIYFRF